MRKPAKPLPTASSARCWLELTPDPRSRNLVLLSGWLLGLMGLAIVLHLPIVLGVKFLLGAAWIADTLAGLRRQARGYARVQCLTLTRHGRVTSHSSTGKNQVIQILNGSVVLYHWAWLRLGFDDGLQHVEWLLRKNCPPHSWRRLQMIWRHSL